MYFPAWTPDDRRLRSAGRDRTPVGDGHDDRSGPRLRRLPDCLLRATEARVGLVVLAELGDPGAQYEAGLAVRGIEGGLQRVDERLGVVDSGTRQDEREHG